MERIAGGGKQEESQPLPCEDTQLQQQPPRPAFNVLQLHNFKHLLRFKILGLQHNTRKLGPWLTDWPEIVCKSWKMFRKFWVSLKFIDLIQQKSHFSQIQWITVMAQICIMAAYFARCPKLTSFAGGGRATQNMCIESHMACTWLKSSRFLCASTHLHQLLLVPSQSSTAATHSSLQCGCKGNVGSYYHAHYH